MHQEPMSLYLVSPEACHPSELVEGSGQVLDVTGLLEGLPRQGELRVRLVDPPLSAVEVAEREVRVARLGLQMQLAVGVFGAVQGAFRFRWPPLCEVEPRDMHMHLCHAQGIGQLWLERLELGGRLRRLLEQARVDVRVRERRMHARERVRVSEARTFDLPEQRLENVDLVTNVTERVQAPRLARAA